MPTDNLQDRERDSQAYLTCVRRLLAHDDILRQEADRWAEIEMKFKHGDAFEGAAETLRSMDINTVRNSPEREMKKVS